MQRHTTKWVFAAFQCYPASLRRLNQSEFSTQANRESSDEPRVTAGFFHRERVTLALKSLPTNMLAVPCWVTFTYSEVPVLLGHLGY